MSPNQTSLNDDDYQYYDKKPIWKIIFIILGIAVVAAIVFFVFIKEPKFSHNEITETVDTTMVTKPQPAPVQEPDPVVMESRTAAGNKFHIIAGAFIVEKNASAYMEELEKKGYNPQILLKKNEYSFISLFSYPTFKEANSKYKELENQGFPIWIMKYKI
jgi:cell division septation protein DedD